MSAEEDLGALPLPPMAGDVESLGQLPPLPTTAGGARREEPRAADRRNEAASVASADDDDNLEAALQSLMAPSVAVSHKHAAAAAARVSESAGDEEALLARLEASLQPGGATHGGSAELYVDSLPSLPSLPLASAARQQPLALATPAPTTALQGAKLAQSPAATGKASPTPTTAPPTMLVDASMRNQYALPLRVAVRVNEDAASSPATTTKTPALPLPPASVLSPRPSALPAQPIAGAGDLVFDEPESYAGELDAATDESMLSASRELMTQIDAILSDAGLRSRPTSRQLSPIVGS